MIPTASHPSNNDPTSHLVWEDRMRSRQVYSVKGGFIATEYPMAYEGLFPTQAAAVAALSK